MKNYNKIEQKKTKIGIILVTNILDDTKYAEKCCCSKTKGRLFLMIKKSKINKKILERAGLDV